jgi:squalene-hopene/tetraprenyl-beta-curcumene cyclase
MIAWSRVLSLLILVLINLPSCTAGQGIDSAQNRDRNSSKDPVKDASGSDYRELADFSFADGVASLVEAKQSWREKLNCISCHTNGWGLAAQPVIDPRSTEVIDGRAFAQQYLTKYIDGDEKPHNRHGSVEGMVATAAFLAMSDARSGQQVHPTTRKGLDNAWKLMNDSGAWEDWLQCNWPPYESDAEFGPTLMLVALGELEEITDLKSQDRAAAQRLISYLTDNPPQSLHDKTMRLWAAKSWPNLVREVDKAQWCQELEKAQTIDGGWSMASLAGPSWKRNGGEGQTTTSEAYPTAFVTYVLLKTGLATQKSITDEGLLWLQKHQRQTGDWYTRSPRRDRKHYISRAATAFALMAIAEKNSEVNPQPAR